MPDRSMLREALVSRAPPSIAGELRVAAGLDERLAELLDHARAAWPGVEVEERDFFAYLGERLVEGESATRALAALHATDLYLACACSATSGPAIAAFGERFLARIDAALPRGIAAHDLSDEVKQIVREKLFVGQAGTRAKIADYSGRSPLHAWVRVVVSRAALDLLRARTDVERDAEDALARVAAPLADPELQHLKDRYRHEFGVALREAAVSLSVRERNLLRQHFADKLTLDELATLYRVHRVTLSRRVSAARDKLAAETRRLLLVRFGIGKDELESLMVLVRSQLDLSIGALFATKSG